MRSVFHGGGLDAAIEKFGGNRDTWLDLSTGINPNSYPLGAIKPEAWARLPDQRAQNDLEQAARTYYCVPDAAGLIVGNGTQAIIELLPSVLGSEHVAIVSPTYGEHAHTWQKVGVAVTAITTVDNLIESVDALVVVNPNNPDCRLWEPRDLFDAARKVKHFIIDEAFCDAYPENSLIPTLPDNVIVLRSFGKFFGLAGLRLGFAIAHTEITGKLASKLGPWAVSGPALEIGAGAFSDFEWIANTRKQLCKASTELARLLKKHDLQIEGHNLLFTYARHEKAHDLFKYLASQHILVRPFPQHADKLRFGLCADGAELGRLEKALISYG